MKLLPNQNYAVTINPLTKHLYDGKRYDEHTILEQRCILQRMLEVLGQQHDVLDIGFESTKAQNCHVHFTLHILSEKHVFEKTIQTMLSLSPREVVIKEIFSPQWRDYALKEQAEKPIGFLF